MAEHEILKLLKLMSGTFTIGCEERTRISAALLDLQERREAEKCRSCAGNVDWTGTTDDGIACPDCNGTGKRSVNAELAAALRSACTAFARIYADTCTSGYDSGVPHLAQMAQEGRNSIGAGSTAKSRPSDAVLKRWPPDRLAGLSGDQLLAGRIAGFRCGIENLKQVLGLAQKVADTFCEMTPLHQTKTIFDLTDDCRALAAALPRNK